MAFDHPLYAICYAPFFSPYLFVLGVSPEDVDRKLADVLGAGGRVTTWQGWKEDDWARAKHIADRLMSSANQSKMSSSVLVYVMLFLYFIN